jgi:signal transduction histidine kinase
VRISTRRSAGNALLTVADEGRGIDAGHRERLFDGFFSSKVSGNGIGLALCKNIIARHRGDIWAQPGEVDGEVRGTRFCFTLPLAEHHN